MAICRAFTFQDFKDDEPNILPNLHRNVYRNTKSVFYNHQLSGSIFYNRQSLDLNPTGNLWSELRGQEEVVQDLSTSVSNLARYYRASDKILMVRKPSCLKHKMSVCLRFKYHLLHIFLHEGCLYIHTLYIYCVCVCSEK